MRISLFISRGPGRIPEAVAMDVNQRAAWSGRKKISGAHGLEGRVKTRLSDGFSALEARGGGQRCDRRNGRRPCDPDPERGGRCLVGTLKECILQPQSEIEKVRAFLLEEGFLFIKEDMVEEDGKYYPMMKDGASCRQNRTERPCGTSGDMGRDGAAVRQVSAAGDRNPVLRQYLEREIRIKTQITGRPAGTGFTAGRRAGSRNWKERQKTRRKG